MLLPYTTHVYYGPGAAAQVTQAAGAVEAQARGFARAGQVTQGVGSVPFAKPTRLRGSVLAVMAVGALVRALPKARVRPGVLIRVNELSQDDVTGAVLEAVIEDGLSLKEALRLLLAYAAGDATGLDTNPIFRSMDGSKTRLAGTISSGTRTITTKDAS